MKVTREDTKVTEKPTKREESPVISDILLQRGVRKAVERDRQASASRRDLLVQLKRQRPRKTFI